MPEPVPEELTRINRLPMRVELEARARSPKEAAELLELAREKAVDPAVFDATPPFFCSPLLESCTDSTLRDFKRASISFGVMPRVARRLCRTARLTREESLVCVTKSVAERL